MAIEILDDHPGEVKAAQIELADDTEERSEASFAHKFISASAMKFLSNERSLVVASRARNKQVWCSLLTGLPGFISAPAERRVRITALPWSEDPLAQNLGPGGSLGLLGIDFFTQRFVILEGELETPIDGISLHTQEVFANRHPHIHQRRLISDAVGTTPTFHHDIVLDANVQEWIRNADTFFLATHGPKSKLYASHRSGRPGFVRVVDNRTILYAHNPDDIFSTHLNLARDWHAGLLFLDFEHGRTLQVTGLAHVISDPAWVGQFDGTQLVLEFAIEEVIHTDNATPLRWRLLRYSV